MSYFLMNLPAFIMLHFRINRYNLHDGVDVTGVIDVLNGVTQNPFARRLTVGVPQAAARFKHTHKESAINNTFNLLLAILVKVH